MDYYLEIKNELVENEITERVKDYSKNKSDLMHYYNVGKLLVEAQGGEQNTTYGNSLIKEYSKRLTIELGKGYSWRNLYNMRTYYLLLSRNTKLQALPAILSWSHIVELLPIHDVNEITYYIGEGFSFIKDEYKIKIGSNFNYIDLLLFNVEFNCYVVVELKVTELKKKNIGQIEVYMNYIDKHIKKIYHDKTIVSREYVLV